MAVVDIGGGQWRDLDTEEQYLDIVAEKISFEFSEELREMLHECEICREDMMYDADRIGEENRELTDQLREINEIISDYLGKMKHGTVCFSRKKVLPMLEKLEELSEV